MMTLTNTGTESDTERWEEPDGNAVEYRAVDGAVLRFEAFTGMTLGLRRKIGVEIVTRHGRFEVAEIDSRYFVSSNDRDHDIVKERSSARNATRLEQHESKHGGAAAGLPGRVDGLCRAQWRGARFRYVVTTGQLDPEATADAPEFPDGFPENWPTLGGVEVEDWILVLTGALGQRRTESFTVRNKERTPQTITVHSPTHRSFEVKSGDLIIPAGASVHVPVRFRANELDTAVGSLLIDTPTGTHQIELKGTVDVGGPGIAPSGA
jgi:hypothetical protein